VSALPGIAALASLAAAFVGLARPANLIARVVRILAVVAAVAMVPSLEEPSWWPAVAVVAGAAVFAAPMPCVFAAAAAAMVALGSPVLQPEAVAAPVLAALAFAAGAASLGSEGTAWLRSGSDRSWPAAWAGFAFCLVAAVQGKGQSLAWRFGLGASDVRATIPGAGLLLGLALLVTLCGSLALTAHLLTPEVPSAGVQRFGQGALVLGAGLGVLATGLVLVRGLQAAEALSANAGGLVALMLAAAALVAALVVLIGPPSSGEAQPWARQAALEARIGCGLAVAAAVVAGLEGWVRFGSYAMPLTASAASAALLALAVLEPTKLGLLRKALWLVALAFVVAG
jgi:hypothetical protein